MANYERQPREPERLSGGESKNLQRRRFLGIVGGGTAALALTGCSDDDGGGADGAVGGADARAADAGAADALGADATAGDAARIDGGAAQCPDPFAGGSKVGDVAFLDGGVPLDRKVNSGLDGRLYTDLRQLDPSALVIDNDSFYIRTHEPDQIDRSKPWSLEISGLVASSQAKSLAFSDIASLEVDQGLHLLECSGNGPGGSFGLMSTARWAGIPVADVLKKLAIDSKATRLVVRGFDGHSKPSANNHSTPGASWNFSFDQLTSRKAFFATKMNGVALPEDHGAPLRLLVPSWYGCTCIKWVDGLQLVDDTAPATSQMLEFATRTHQNGKPPLAKDWRPANIEQAAMPVRVEKWKVGGKVAYKVVGIIWGGDKPTNKLTIRFDKSEPFVPVDVCPTQTTNATWTLWVHRWEPTRTGQHTLRLAVNDASVPTRRLDWGWYDREVNITEV